MRINSQGVENRRVTFAPFTVYVSDAWRREDGHWMGGLDLRFEGADGNEVNLLLSSIMVAQLRSLVTSDYNEEEE